MISTGIMHCLMGKNTIIFYTRQTIPGLGKWLHGLSDTIFFLPALGIMFFLCIIWLLSLQYMEVASQLRNCQLHLPRLRIHSCYCCFCWHLGERRTRKAQGLWADAMRSCQATVKISIKCADYTTLCFFRSVDSGTPWQNQQVTKTITNTGAEKIR